MENFENIIDVKKVTSCKTCSTYIYTLPCNFTEEIADFLLPFGKLAYDLNRVKIIKLENEYLSISQGRIGSNKLKVRFNRDAVSMKELFDIHIASYVEKEQKIKIKVS